MTYITTLFKQYEKRSGRSGYGHGSHKLARRDSGRGSDEGGEKRLTPTIEACQ